MIFLYAYILVAAVTMGLSSAERGYREGSTIQNYNPEDFFAPLFQGAGWPIFLFTGIAYRFGIHKRKRKEELDRSNAKLLRELAPHMDEVEKLLASKR